jgi:site-specific DNA-cytosine methylase
VVKGSHVSLFTGMGMLDLAAETMGFETVLTAETLSFCRDVLVRRFQSTPYHFRDVRHVHAGGIVGNFDPASFARPMLMSGGFPCHGASSAGTAKGMNDPRTGLWSEFARLIGEFRPEFVMIENSARLLSRGMDRVLLDLATLGYDAQWDCIPAASVGAPHLRDRVWIGAKRGDQRKTDRLEAWGSDDFLAASRSTTRQGWGRSRPGHGIEWITSFPRAGKLVDGALMTWTPAATIKACREDAKRRGQRLFPTPTRSDGTGGPGTTPRREGGKNLRTVAHEIEGNGRLHPLFVEWMMGLPSGWTDPTVSNAMLQPHAGWHWSDPVRMPMTTARRVPHRGDRIRALGNGLVPQVACVAIQDLLRWAEGRPV